MSTTIIRRNKAYFIEPVVEPNTTENSVKRLKKVRDDTTGSITANTTPAVEGKQQFRFNWADRWSKTTV